MKIEITGDNFILTAAGVQRLLYKQVDEFVFDPLADKFTMHVCGGGPEDIAFLRRSGLKVRRIYWFETITKKIAAHAKNHKW